MTLPSRHRIWNSNPGGLRSETLPLGHGGSPQYWVLRVDGEETCLFLSNRRDRETNSGKINSLRSLTHDYYVATRNQDCVMHAMTVKARFWGYTCWCPFLPPNNIFWWTRNADLAVAQRWPASLTVPGTTPEKPSSLACTIDGCLLCRWVKVSAIDLVPFLNLTLLYLISL